MRPTRLLRTELCLAAALLALAGRPSAADAQTIEALLSAQTLDERARLVCPPADAAGDFAEPAEYIPTRDLPIETYYSGRDDLIRLSGVESEVVANADVGDDIVLLYDTEASAVAVGGNGDDTILLCSMTDLSAYLDIGSLGQGPEADVAIIDGAVFANVPQGMLRVISVTYEAGLDRIVIHGPPELLANWQPYRPHDGIRIGQVIILASSGDIATGTVILAPDGTGGESLPADAVPSPSPADVRTILVNAWQAQGCVLTESEIGEEARAAGFDGAAVHEALAAIRGDGHLVEQDDGTLILSGLGACPELASPADAAVAPGAWRVAEIDEFRMGIAEIATTTGVVQLDCGNFGRFSVTVEANGIAPSGSATMVPMVDGRAFAGMEMHCDGTACTSQSVVEDGALIAALRGGRFITLLGLTETPIAFPLTGSSRAIGAFGCSSFY